MPSPHHPQVCGQVRVTNFPNREAFFFRLLPAEDFGQGGRSTLLAELLGNENNERETLRQLPSPLEVA